MKKDIPNGVWPTMITPFTPDGKIDYRGTGDIIQWYLKGRVDGLFAVCQSSEMFYLSLPERESLARFVAKEAGGIVPVIASGHISDSIDDQIDEIKRMAETGVDAVVIVSNRLAGREESDGVWIENAQKIIESTKGISFGIYECPHPYKRIMTPELIDWCVSTGRFSFLKDTCCDIDQIKAKLERVKGSRLKIFNANSATLLESLQLGAAGFSGVMANFHPELYVWMTENWRDEPEKALELQYFLSLASLAEYQFYPVNAKYHMKLENITIKLITRSKDDSGFSISMKREIEHLRELSYIYRERLFTGM